MVELKNGETYNGILFSSDVWMNLHLKDVVLTSSAGDKFWKINECFIRGNTIKYLRVPEEIAEKVKEHAEKKRQRNVGGFPKSDKGSGEKSKKLPSNVS